MLGRIHCHNETIQALLLSSEVQAYGGLIWVSTGGR